MTPTIEDVASRIVSKTFDTLKQDESYSVTYLRNRFTPIITAELAALVESRDALLRECRAIVQDRKGAWEIVDKTFHQDETKRQGEVAKCTDLLARIDAVLKGGV